MLQCSRLVKTQKVQLRQLLAAGLLMISFGCQEHSSKVAKSTDDIERAALEAEQADEDISKLKASGAVESTSSRKPSSTGVSSSKSQSKVQGKSEAKRPNQWGQVSTTKSTTSAGEAAYTVQVGTFKVQENAAKLERALKEKGLPVFTRRIDRGNGEVLFAIRLEPTPKRSEAETLVAAVKNATGQAAVILTVKP